MRRMRVIEVGCNVPCVLLCLFMPFFYIQNGIFINRLNEPAKPQVHIYIYPSIIIILLII